MNALRARLTKITQDDGGFTLVELLAAMTVFTIVLVMVGAAMRDMTDSTVRVSNTGQSITEVARVYNRFDKQVPYAAAINDPGVVAGSRHYVEFRTDVQAGGLAPACWQYRLDTATGLLQVRSAPSSTPAAVSPWSTLATDMGVVPQQVDPVTGALTQPPPFALSRKGTDFDRQRLTVALQTQRPRAAAQGLRTTWVARNSVNSITEEPALSGVGYKRTCEGMPRP